MIDERLIEIIYPKYKKLRKMGYPMEAAIKLCKIDDTDIELPQIPQMPEIKIDESLSPGTIRFCDPFFGSKSSERKQKRKQKILKRKKRKAKKKSIKKGRNKK